LNTRTNVPTIRVLGYHIVDILPKDKAFMKRIFLFIVTNLAVLALLSLVIFVIEQVFGIRLGLGGMGGLLLAQIVLGIFASLIVSWYSRQREFRADRGGANLAGTGLMIGALEVLKRSQGEPMPPQLQAFGINSGPRELYDFMHLFMSHPPLDARIEALRSPR
jgi:heat shock protein HtpX